MDGDIGVVWVRRLFGWGYWSVMGEEVVWMGILECLGEEVVWMGILEWYG